MNDVEKIREDAERRDEALFLLLKKSTFKKEEWNLIFWYLQEMLNCYEEEYIFALLEGVLRKRRPEIFKSAIPYPRHFLQRR